MNNKPPMVVSNECTMGGLIMASEKEAFLKTDARDV